MIVRRVGALSFARVSGFIYAFIGLILGACFALLSVLGGAATGEASGPVAGAIFGAGAIVILPLLYGGLGFVVSLLGAALYNWAAGLLGGIEIDIAEGSQGAGIERGV